jgi:hypothetical protein
VTVPGAKRDHLVELYERFSRADADLRSQLAAGETHWARAEVQEIERHEPGSYHVLARRWTLDARQWLRSPAAEQRARLGDLEATDVLLRRAGKGATGVTGQPAFDAAASELLALARKGPHGKREINDVLQAYAKVVEAFNHLALT